MSEVSVHQWLHWFSGSRMIVARVKCTNCTTRKHYWLYSNYKAAMNELAYEDLKHLLASWARKWEPPSKSTSVVSNLPAPQRPQEAWMWSAKATTRMWQWERGQFPRTIAPGSTEPGLDHKASMPFEGNTWISTVGIL